MSHSRTKCIISGASVELYCFEKPYSYDFEITEEELQMRSCKKLFLTDKEYEDRKLESRKKSKHRARNLVRRLALANYKHWRYPDGSICEPTFITFTFPGDANADFDIRSIPLCNEYFSLFIKRLNYKIFGTTRSVAKYIIVPEFQKRGAVHYHAVFFNLPSEVVNEKARKKRTVARIWQGGKVYDRKKYFVDFKKIYNADHAAYYVTKYMAKAYGDNRLDGKKKYFCSRGILRPIVLRNIGDINNLQSYMKNSEKTYEKLDIDSEHQGKIEYRIYRVADENVEKLHKHLKSSTLKDN